ncbi:DegT/DnrJ/EryC1/StrS family aminotransferase [Emcibacter sp.]|uniref:DegT/DnrJ/EryC1/StrS family aminotransferase n=1 Tax=Emcibacter sp. TaxID=1979954 RepID=UPI003A914B5F
MSKVWSKPLSPWPNFEQDEIDAAVNVLQSGKVNYWTGNECNTFEEEFAAYTRTAHAIAVANGTLALELALHALDISEGDEVIVTPRTFLASASCIVREGATPVFADVDPISGNLTAETITGKITDKTKAVILVHLAGWPCEMDPIMELAEQYNFYVIEDCAQAHGAEYRGRPVGSIGHVGCFSFCQDKIMTTGGEGGMLVTNDTELWKKAWGFKDHGKSYDAVFQKEHPPGFRWLHESFGTNYRLTEMQAAIGRRQLAKLPDWTEARQKNAAILDECVANLPALKKLDVPAYVKHARYKYYTYVDETKLKPDWNRDRIREAIWDEGITCMSGSCSEIYKEKAFDGTTFRPAQALPVARKLGDISLMFLIHHTLTAEEMDASCRAIEKVMQQAMK